MMVFNCFPSVALGSINEVQSLGGAFAPDRLLYRSICIVGFCPLSPHRDNRLLVERREAQGEDGGVLRGGGGERL